MSHIVESKRIEATNFSPFTASTPAITSLCPAINLVAECITMSRKPDKNQEVILRIKKQNYLSIVSKYELLYTPAPSSNGRESTGDIILLSTNTRAP